VTVRSDLSALEGAGLVRRLRGAVTRHLYAERPIEENQQRHAAAKRRIGRAAAALVQDGETIFLDVGSSSAEVARHLSPALRGVTVITNGLNIALEVEKLPELRVIVTGGTLRRLQHSLVSPYALDLISRVQAHRLFLGCNGVDAQAGVTNANHEEAEIKRAMVAASREVHVLADRSKLGAVASARVVLLAAVQTLISDAPPDCLILPPHVQFLHV
jgi:DeoR/GlpR family transcriptional regulator of sugar metabolism